MIVDDRISIPERGIAAPHGRAGIPPELENKIDLILIPEAALRARVEALAERICLDYRGTSQITFLIVLEGARVFAEALGRGVAALGGPAVELDYIKARTYGDEIKSAGESSRQVTITVEPRRIKGKHIVVVEDIVDQGFTLTKIHELVLEQEPASLRTCALLLKRLDDPTRAVRKLRDELRISYAGFDVPDRWVAGYGIDVGGELRELPYVIAANEKHYSTAAAKG
jgi:hypoxanthine phosphoribosyltransferase